MDREHASKGATGALAMRPLHGTEAEIVEFLAGRSVPCPRCAYDLRDIETAKCPECGEPLVLKIGSPRVRFGWLLLAMAPGCFSGVAALFVAVPVVGSLWVGMKPGGSGIPWPAIIADGFGFMSAASVVLMYRHRHRILGLKTKRQATLAGTIWGIHILMFLVLLAWMSYLY